MGLSKEVTLHHIAWDFHGLLALPPIGNMPQSARITILHTRDTRKHIFLNISTSYGYISQYNNENLKLNNINLNSHFPKSDSDKISYGADMKLTFLRTSFSCR